MNDRPGGKRASTAGPVRDAAVGVGAAQPGVGGGGALEDVVLGLQRVRQRRQVLGEAGELLRRAALGRRRQRGGGGGEGGGPPGAAGPCREGTFLARRAAQADGCGGA